MWNQSCNLGVLRKAINEVGDLTETIIYEKEVYCKEKSIKYNEFYQAHAVGLRPELTLEIMLIDYDKEEYVLYDEEEYKVLRVYKTSPERIELTLVRGVNNGNS